MKAGRSIGNAAKDTKNSKKSKKREKRGGFLVKKNYQGVLGELGRAAMRGEKGTGRISGCLVLKRQPLESQNWSK